MPATASPSALSTRHSVLTGPLKTAPARTDPPVMRVIPTNTGAMIQFCLDHYPVWEADPARIGLTPEQVQTLVDLTKESRDLLAAALAAREAAEAATLRMKTKAAQLRAYAGGLVATIKSFASTAGVGDQEAEPPGAIYARARIPVPENLRGAA